MGALASVKLTFLYFEKYLGGNIWAGICGCFTEFLCKVVKDPPECFLEHFLRLHFQLYQTEKQLDCHPSAVWDS